jgi:C4-type Zn-finger protein
VDLADEMESTQVAVTVIINDLDANSIILNTEKLISNPMGDHLLDWKSISIKAWSALLVERYFYSNEMEVIISRK